MAGAVLLLGLLACGQAEEPPLRRIVETPPPHKYVRFEIRDNPEKTLNDFLQSKDGHDLLQKVVSGGFHQLLDHPPSNLDELARKYSDNPFLGDFVKKFIAENPQLNSDPSNMLESLKKFSERFGKHSDVVEKMTRDLESTVGPKGLAELKKLVDQFDGNPNLAKLKEIVDTLEARPRDDLPKLEDFPDPGEFGLEDRVGEWVMNLLKREDVQSELGEFLADSPEMKEALADLLKSLGDADGGANWLQKLPEMGRGKWGLDWKPPPLDLGNLPKLPAMSLPQLPRFQLPMPKMGRWKMPQLPGLGGARMPTMPSVSGNRDWLYLVAGVMAVGLAWWFIRKVRWRSGGDAVAALLAALPNEITTRTQLQAAFDALALAKLGHQARPWNHRHIARQLAGAPEQTRAADAFAHLYELARYTPGDDPLTAAEQDAVRASLSALTGGAV